MKVEALCIFFCVGFEVVLKPSNELDQKRRTRIRDVCLVHSYMSLRDHHFPTVCELEKSGLERGAGAIRSQRA